MNVMMVTTFFGFCKAFQPFPGFKPKGNIKVITSNVKATSMRGTKIVIY